jgi:hypothetical protein
MGFGIQHIATKMQRIAFVPLLAAVALIVASAASTSPASALDGEETAFLGLINQYRAANGLGGLSLNETLNTAARWMSDDMATKNYFSHTDSLGRDPFTRMAAFGYNYNTWKREPRRRLRGAQAAFDLWRNSLATTPTCSTATSRSSASAAPTPPARLRLVLDHRFRWQAAPRLPHTTASSPPPLLHHRLRRHPHRADSRAAPEPLLPLLRRRRPLPCQRRMAEIFSEVHLVGQLVLGVTALCQRTPIAELTDAKGDLHPSRTRAAIC